MTQAPPALSLFEMFEKALEKEGDGATANRELDLLPFVRLCLKDQPFGFTPDDVDHLLELARYFDSSYAGEQPILRSLAARIAALLPPLPKRPMCPRCNIRQVQWSTTMGDPVNISLWKHCMDCTDAIMTGSPDTCHP